MASLYLLAMAEEPASFHHEEYAAVVVGALAFVSCVMNQ